MDEDYEAVEVCYRCVNSAISILNQIPDDVWNRFMSLPNEFSYDVRDGNAYFNRARDDMKHYLGIKDEEE